MDKHIEEIKKDYSIEKGFFDKIYLTVEETKVIEGMKHKERNIYLKQNEIALDDDNLSKNCGKYYKRNYWDISNDEILFLINLDNNILLNKINNHVLSIFWMFVLFLICAFIFFRFI